MSTQRKASKSKSTLNKRGKQQKPQSTVPNESLTEVDWLARATESPEKLSPNAIVQMQRMIGNQAVSQLIGQPEARPQVQRKPIANSLLRNLMIQRWPAPETDDTPAKSNFSIYKCHDAVVYWVLRAIGYTTEDAIESLELAHQKLGPSSGWIVKALGYTTSNPVTGPGQVGVGDILFTGHTSFVAHTMVVIDNDHIKGFNNYGTFGTSGGGDQYSVEEFSNPKFWHDVDGKQQMGGADHASFPVYKVDIDTAKGALTNFISGVSHDLPEYRDAGMDVVVSKGEKRALEGKPKKKGCYITTAVTLTRGLPDDCEELTVLRAFRDDYLLAKPDGERLVELYYQYAPDILEEIAKRRDAGAVYRSLYDVIRSCVDAVKQGDNDFAYRMYCRMVIKLQEEYLPDAPLPAYQI